MTTATVAEITAAAASFQAEAGTRYEVRPNSYGIRIECRYCHEAATGDRAYRFPYTHSCFYMVTRSYGGETPNSTIYHGPASIPLEVAESFVSGLGESAKMHHDSYGYIIYQES